MSTLNSWNSEGITPTEKYLVQLGRGTFLRLWSHPNLFKDQGKSGLRGHGQELCDLLVVCGDDIIIFSDKACSYPAHPDPDIAWQRWYRKAIKDSVRQIKRAENWLRDHPDRIFQDRECTQRFAIPVPPAGRARVHRVVVAHGNLPITGSEPHHPSLRVVPSIIGPAHSRRSADGGMPLAIGQVDPKLGFVHVLDDFAVCLLLSELDTISDLLTYLSARERLATKGILVSAESEADLLGYYMDRPGGPSQVFQFPTPGEKLKIGAGTWEKYVASGRRTARYEANRDSYLLDHLIDTMAENAIKGRLLPDPGINVVSVEKILRRVAQEPRIRRRLLANGLIEKVRSSPLNSLAARVFPPSEEGAPTYIFIIFPRTQFVQYKDEEKYREHRHSFLMTYSMAYKATYPETHDVVGIAIDPADPFGNEDFLYIEASSWRSELQNSGEQARARFGFFQSITQVMSITTEYPPEGEPVLSVHIPRPFR